MLEIRFYLVGKGTVMVVDVQDIIPDKIIAHIDILPTIPVDIGDSSCMSIPLESNSGLFGDIRKDRMP